MTYKKALGSSKIWELIWSGELWTEGASVHCPMPLDKSLNIQDLSFFRYTGVHSTKGVLSNYFAAVVEVTVFGGQPGTADDSVKKMFSTA